MASVDVTQHDYKTYRVLGVDKTWDVEKLRVCLASQPGDIQPKVFSLAAETDRRSQTATVVFQNGRVPTSPIRPENIVIENTFHGITPLFTPSKENHKVDIIAIPGLGGHAFGSFKQRGGDHMWLRDSLPKDLVDEGDDERDRPIARIMVYGYASELDDRTSFQSMEDIASSFRQAVEDCRLTKPTIFIGHSFGGILLKEAFIHWTHSKHHAKLLQAIRAIVFFAVPHDGMETTSLIPMVGNTNRKLIDLLDRHNPTKLSSQRELFLKALIARPETEIFSFYETGLSHTAKEDENNPGKWKMNGPLAGLVSQPSATIYRPGGDSPMPIASINRSHSEIVKFGPHDAGYKNVRGALRGLCERAIEKPQLPAVPISENVLKRRKILMESLRFPQIGERLSNIKPAHKTTAEWVLDHPTFRQWQDSTQIPEKHQMIWIKGNPGAGKSTMMKFIYNHMNKRTGKDILVASFFFFGAASELERTMQGMYQSLLWQLLNHFTDLQMVFENTELLEPYRNVCSLVELQSLLQAAVLQLGHRRVFWFIDALDECKEDEVVDMAHYLEELAASTVANGVNLAVCFSSRHYPAIRIRHTTELILDGNADHDNDLKTYIIDRLQVDDSKIVEKVLAKSSGVFLWAVLVVKILNKESLDGGHAMNKRLEDVPEDLCGLFRKLLGQKTDVFEREKTKLSMLWLLFARQFLKPIQYENAIWAGLSSKGLMIHEDSPWDETTLNAHDRATKFVVSSSKGLARVANNGVHFIHESIRDFLLKEKGLAQLWPELEKDIEALGHATTQQCCIRYWNYCSESGPKALTGQNTNFGLGGLLDYVIDYILDHAEAAADVFPQTGFLSTFPTASYITARETSRLSVHDLKADLLYVLSYGGYAKLITAFLELKDASHRIADRRGRHRFPMIAAAAQNHKRAFCSLSSCPTGIYVGFDLFDGLDPFANVGEPSYDTCSYDKHTPLSWAATRGYTQMASKLVRQYQEPINERDGREGTPLDAAVRRGHETTTRFLIKQGADLAAGSPLAQALVCGQEEIAQILINEGADINAGYPLFEALSKGYDDIARLLIKKGANVENGYTFGEALRGGYEEATRLAIHRPARDLPDNPFAKASTRGRKRLFAWLLEKTGHMTMGYPLVEALKRGNNELARLLVQEGADINAGYPLVEASRRGNEELAGLLIRKGADTNAGNPLVEAIRAGSAKIVQLLLTQEADPNFREEHCTTPMYIALKSNAPLKREIIRLLAACEAVEPGDCITLAVWLGDTANLRAVIQGFEDRRDLTASDAINATDTLGRTAIAFASRLGYVEALNLLLEQDKANIAKSDLYGNMPLDAAVRNGHYDVVEILLKNGARLRDTNDLANTSLLGWARLGYGNGNENDIAGLLKSHASVAGCDLRDDTAPAGYEMVHFDARRSWCDVCSLTIPTNAALYKCRICFSMGLAICHVCWRQGFRCLNKQHVLDEHIVEGTVE